MLVKLKPSEFRACRMLHSSSHKGEDSNYLQGTKKKKKGKENKTRGRSLEALRSSFARMVPPTTLLVLVPSLFKHRKPTRMLAAILTEWFLIRHQHLSPATATAVAMVPLLRLWSNNNTLLLLFYMIQWLFKYLDTTTRQPECILSQPVYLLLQSIFSILTACFFPGQLSSWASAWGGKGPPSFLHLTGNRFELSSGNWEKGYPCVKQCNFWGWYSIAYWWKNQREVVWLSLWYGTGFPGGPVVENLPANSGDTGDVGSIPRSGRSLNGRQPSPVFLPGKSHGQRSLMSYSPWGHKELDMTEHAHLWYWTERIQEEAALGYCRQVLA